VADLRTEPSLIRRLTAWWVLACLALFAALPAPLVAQVPRAPVVNNGVPRGFQIAGDVAFPDAASGGGETYVATGALGLGMLGFTGSIGSTQPDVGNAAGVAGGTANLRLIGGPFVPFFVNLQAGVGYGEVNGDKITHVPVGVGLGLTIPLPIFGLKPWFAPRWDYTMHSGSVSDDTSEFGYSAGIDISFIFGLGLRTAYDAVKIHNEDQTSWSVGAKWTLGL
jgi:hypothetical protein